MQIASVSFQIPSRLLWTRFLQEHQVYLSDSYVFFVYVKKLLKMPEESSGFLKVSTSMKEWRLYFSTKRKVSPTFLSCFQGPAISFIGLSTMSQFCPRSNFSNSIMKNLIKLPTISGSPVSFSWISDSWFNFSLTLTTKSKLKMIKPSINWKFQKNAH